MQRKVSRVVLILFAITNISCISNSESDKIIVEHLNEEIDTDFLEEQSMCEKKVDSLLFTLNSCEEIWIKTKEHSFEIHEDCLIYLLENVTKSYKIKKDSRSYELLECFAKKSDGYITDFFMELINEMVIDDLNSLLNDMYYFEVKRNNVSALKNVFILKYISFDSAKNILIKLEVILENEKDLNKRKFLIDLIDSVVKG